MGIALEDSNGIRERSRLNKAQWATLDSWSFAQLDSFVEYKGENTGIPVVFVDLAQTIQTCAICANVANRARKGQVISPCTNTQFAMSLHVEEHAAVNTASRAAGWANVKRLEPGLQTSPPMATRGRARRKTEPADAGHPSCSPRHPQAWALLGRVDGTLEGAGNFLKRQ
ncbi:MAG: zinc ribbon domain-containing protein [Actinomycetota bacterium]|nr:zinc ribbon domain-containing protein [Actinomycetota bacterium]